MLIWCRGSLSQQLQLNMRDKAWQQPGSWGTPAFVQGTECPWLVEAVSTQGWLGAAQGIAVDVSRGYFGTLEQQTVKRKLWAKPTKGSRAMVAPWQPWRRVWAFLSCSCSMVGLSPHCFALPGVNGDESCGVDFVRPKTSISQSTYMYVPFHL